MEAAVQKFAAITFVVIGLSHALCPRASEKPAGSVGGGALVAAVDCLIAPGSTRVGDATLRHR